MPKFKGGSSGKSSRKKNFLGGLHEGAYTRHVKSEYGKKGFNKDGTIKQSVINKDRREGSPKVQRQANLANNMRGWHRK